MAQTPEQSVIEAAGFREQLRKILAFSEDEAFLQMIWGVDCLRGNEPEVGIKYLRAVPLEIMPAGYGDPRIAYPWELETLVNELLSKPKDPLYRFIDCGDWGTVDTLVNVLRGLENAEYGVRRRHDSIFKEMYRIGGRQFEWQHGFFNVAQLYRYLFIYGQGVSAEYFKKTHHISVSDLVAVGVALMGSFVSEPWCERRSDLSLLGISEQAAGLALRRMCAPLSVVRGRARVERDLEIEIAYRPSVLRRFPCISFGSRGRRLRAPLPQLIISRITSGLFYDLIDGGGAVRRDYGRRFEEYVLAYLATVISEDRLRSERRYRADGEPKDTPDVLICAEGSERVEFAVECKARRMSFSARFADEPLEEPGYQEIVRGVCQLWRFFAHSRRGLTGAQVNDDTIGVVLTLDSWLVMGSPLRETVMERANAMADGDAGITPEDRKRVVFTWMLDMEDVLRTATPETLAATLRLAASQERMGWLLHGIHQDLPNRLPESRGFPFSDDLNRLLPWWEQTAADDE
jgi:hypothetical protein